MRLMAALNREPLDRPPIWFMRQAGRYLPEYRQLRSRFSFIEAMTCPEVATDITLQPLRRFPLDAAIVFSDIMTPLTAMGVHIEFDPGPKLSPMTLEALGRLDPLDPARLDFVAETVGKVRHALASDVAVIGFAGGPVTLAAYLLEGGGSQHFPRFRHALHDTDPGAALSVIARAVRAHLDMQIEAGADVVQLFDTWAGLLSVQQFRDWAIPAAREALAGLDAPAIYFVPGGAHLLEALVEVGASAYGVDWRLPLDRVWSRIGEDRVLQGNLDPAVLLTSPDVVKEATRRVLDSAAGRPGHIFNLGHGVLPTTPVENVAAMVETVVSRDIETVPSNNEKGKSPDDGTRDP